MNRPWPIPGANWFGSLGLALILLGCGLVWPLCAAELPGLDENFRIDWWQTEDGLPQNSVTDIAQTPDGYLWLGTFNGLVRFDGVRFVVFDDATTPELPSGRIVNLALDAQGRLWIMSESGYLTVFFNDAFRPARDYFPELPEKIGTLCGGAASIFILGRDESLFQIHGAIARRLPRMDLSAGGRIVSMASDGKGDVWIAQKWILRRVIGDSVITVETHPAEKDSPAEDSPVDMLEPARDGGLWATRRRGGLCKYRDGKLIFGPAPFPVNTGGTAMIHEDTRGNIWLASNDAGLLRYSTNGQWRVFSTTNGLSLNSVRCVDEDVDGNFWAGTDGGGLNRLRSQTIEVWDQQRGLADDMTLSVTADPSGLVWIGLNGKGLNRLNGDKVEQIVYPGLLEKGAPWSILSDRKGGLWFSLQNDGQLNHADANGRTIVYQQPNPSRKYYVRALLEDREGAIWVGDLGGVRRFKDGHFTGFGVEDGMPPGGVRALVEGKTGEIYFGTEGGGLVRRNKDGLQVFSKKEGLPDDRIWSLCVDHEGVLWIGTYGAGLVRFKDGQFTSFRQDLPVRQITCLLTDDQGGLWAGSMQGLFRLEIERLNARAEGRISELGYQGFARDEGMRGLECSSGHQPAACRSTDGRLWFATIKGVAVVDPKNIAPPPPPPRVRIEEVLIDNVPHSTSGTEASLVTIPPGRHHLEIHYTALSLSAPKRVRFWTRLAGFDDEWTDAGETRITHLQGVPPGTYHFQIKARNAEGVWSAANLGLELVFQPYFWQRTWFILLAVLLGGAAMFGLYEVRLARLRLNQARQADFSRRLIHSQEQERKRIAAGLHDSLGQNLLIIKNRATLALSGSNASQPTSDVLEEISRTASESLQEVREISHDLRPYQLDRLGLTKALQIMCRKVAESSGVQLECDVEPVDGLFPTEEEINLYRIVQEGLNNMVKHAEASAGRVVIRREDKKLTLLIEDNGKGFDSTAREIEGLGLTSIRERARILGGLVHLETNPGKGSVLRIELSL